MRNQLIAIFVLGVLALLGFGLMAGYLSDINPRVKLKLVAERELPVVVESVTDYLDGVPVTERAEPLAPSMPRTVVVVCRPSDGAEPTLALARAVAAKAHDVFARKGVQKVRVAAWTVELEGFGSHTWPAATVSRWSYLENVLAGARERVAADLGDDTELAIIEDAIGRHGLSVRAPAVPDRTPEDLARAVLSRTGYQFQFVRVEPPDPDAPGAEAHVLSTAELRRRKPKTPSTSSSSSPSGSPPRSGS